MFKLVVMSLAVIFRSFGLKKKHTLTVLLSLEILRVLIIIIALILAIDYFFGLMMICVGACEGAVGLGSLIGNARVRGGCSL